MQSPGDTGGQDTALDFDITMAFQPIVDVEQRNIFAYEALVRGTDGATAESILARVTDDNRHAFDQRCRVRAVELASALGMQPMLSINFMPNAVHDPARDLRAMLETALRSGFSVSQIILETTEDHGADDELLRNIFSTYRMHGFKTALDGFGAGYGDLNLLADFQPDFLKIDSGLVRDIEKDRARQTIVGAIAAIGNLLGVRVIAKGLEDARAVSVLHHLGINLMQGYLFAEPGFETLPRVNFDAALASGARYTGSGAA